MAIAVISYRTEIKLYPKRISNPPRNYGLWQCWQISIPLIPFILANTVKSLKRAYSMISKNSIQLKIDFLTTSHPPRAQKNPFGPICFSIEEPSEASQQAGSPFSFGPALFVCCCVVLVVERIENGLLLAVLCSRLLLL